MRQNTIGGYMKSIFALFATLLLTTSVFAFDTTFVDLVKKNIQQEAAKGSGQVTMCIRKCLMNGEEYNYCLQMCSKD